MHRFVDEDVLGLERSTLPTLVNRVAKVGFERGMVSLAWASAQLDDEGSELERQIAFVDRFYSDEALAAKIVELARKGGYFPFAEQHFFALQRLLVLHAAERPFGEPIQPGEGWTLERAYLGMSALTLEGDGDEADEAHWLAFLVQNAAYYAQEPLLEGMTRAHAIFSDIARRPEFVTHPQFVPIADWAAESGLTLEQQFALGLSAMTVGFSAAESEDGSKPVVMRPDRFADIATRIGTDVETATSLLAADRAWYQREFERTADDPLDVVWNRLPFERRPFLRLDDQSLCLIAPRLLASWLTDGFYYRALDSARAHGQVRRFTNFFGVLVETYVCELVEALHPQPRPAGSGVVHREIHYGGGKLSPDLAIDYGQDLVLMEIVSSRLTVGTRLRREQATVEKDLDKVLIDKARQLSNRIDDLIDDQFHIPAVEMTDVQRIWPVLVTPSGLIENELLWRYLAVGIDGSLDQARVQPLVLLDFVGLERLMGLVEAGFAIHDVLREKTHSVYRRIDFQRFVTDDPRYPNHRARRLVDSVTEMFDDVAAVLGFDLAELRAMREREGLV